MSDFQTDNARAKPFERLILGLLRGWGFEAGENPFNGTSDPQRADYDVWCDIGRERVYLELKDDFKSAETPNFCLEIKAVRHSKAPLFVYHIRNPECFWTFHVWELENLIHSPAYRHCKIGEFGDEGVLVPKEVLKSVGRPFETAIRQLTKQAA